MNKTDVKEIKEMYEMLSWRCVKGNNKVPKEYNIILDLIEYIEDITKREGKS